MNNILNTNHTSIYKLLFVLFFAGICNLPFKCNAQEYSKLDEVPQWVKEKVNHEEYKLWEVMSSVFQIDYSFLKKDISQERKKEILHLLQNTVSRIQNGSYNIEKGSLFCVADEFKIDSLTNWSTEILECRKKSGIIYSSRDGYDAHYKLTVIYGYDKMNKKVYPIKNELECISYSGIEITCNDLPIVKYNEVEGKLQGTCYGNLFFKDEKGATHSEDFTKYFVLEP